MIDVPQQTSLISAFRVETEKESISLEPSARQSLQHKSPLSGGVRKANLCQTVGKILQDITDLLSTASTEAERKILDDWKAMLSSLIFVYDIEHASGMKDPEHLFLTIRGQRFSNGAKFSSSVPIGAATDMSAGAMSATHVQTIMALQAAVSQLRSSVSDLETNSSRHSQQLNIIRAAGYVVTDIKQVTGNPSKVQLSLSEHDVRTGEDFAYTKFIAGATNQQAGVMTASHVASLETAKTDITDLKRSVNIIRNGAIFVDGAQVSLIDTNRMGITLFGYDVRTGEQQVELNTVMLPSASTYGAGLMSAAHAKLLETLRQAIFGGNNGLTKVGTLLPLAIEINLGKDALMLRGVTPLIQQGLVPYLFRYSRKRNREISPDGVKTHGDIRKGWNVVGRANTLRVDNSGTVGINKMVFKHPDEEIDELDQYLYEPKYFVSDKLDEASGVRYVPFGKSRVDLALKQQNGSYKMRKVRLQYGIAFATQRVGDRDLLDRAQLVTPIVPFHVSTVLTNNGGYHWVFER